MISRRLRADRATDADLLRPLENAGEHDVHDADPADQQRDRGDRDHHHLEDPLRAALLRQQLGGHHDAEVPGLLVRVVEQAADDARGGNGLVGRGQLQVDAVDLVPPLALRVLQAEDGRGERRVDDVVAILGRQAARFVLRRELRAGDADDAEPLLVDLHVLAERGLAAEQRRAHALAQHRDRRRPRLVIVGQEAALGQPDARDALVGRLHAVDGGHVGGRLRDHLRRHEALARRRGLDAGDVGAHRPQVLEGQSRRDAAHFLKGLIVLRLARLDDEIAHPEILDERHHLLLRTGADGQHGHDGRDAEDHAEHRQQRSELVDEQILDPELHRRDEVGRQGEARGRGRGLGSVVHGIWSLVSGRLVSVFSLRSSICGLRFTSDLLPRTRAFARIILLRPCSSAVRPGARTRRRCAVSDRRARSRRLR